MVQSACSIAPANREIRHYGVTYTEPISAKVDLGFKQSQKEFWKIVTYLCGKFISCVDLVMETDSLIVCSLVERILKIEITNGKLKFDAVSTDLSDPLSPLLPIVHRSREVFKVLAGRPAFAHPRDRVYRSTSLISSSLLLEQCSACLVRLTLIVFVIFTHTTATIQKRYHHWFLSQSSTYLLLEIFKWWIHPHRKFLPYPAVLQILYTLC